MLMRRMISAILAIVMAVVFIPPAQAMTESLGAGTIGKLNGTSYTSFKSLVSALESNYENSRVTIEMTANWNAAGSDDFNRRLIIPEGCNASLYMHGYVFNRNLCWDNDTEYNGELICMQSGSSLTIIGSDNDREKAISHPLVSVYTSTNKDGKANGRITTYGGTLTGGSSKNGAGGIHVKDRCNLTLTDVTLAGCSSRKGTRSNGYGGGIYVKSDYSKVILNHSVITGCFADIDGGGIYANDEPTTIELYNSSIDKNYATRNGGGIYTNDQHISISGYNDSSITNNQSGDYGGGVCVWYGDSSLSGLTISGNKSTRGGGIHLDSTSISLSNLTVTGNKAERGAGVFVYKNENSITSCVITGNSASVSGGGVYVDSDVKKSFSVGGKTIIRDNSASLSYGKNFYFSDNNPSDSRANFSLTKGSDVHVGYWDTKDRDSIMVTEGAAGDTKKTPNCIQYLTADNAGYHFTYNSAPDQRKIYYVKNGKDSASTGSPAQTRNDPTDVLSKDAINQPGKESSYDSAKAGIVGTLHGDGTYDLIRGFTRHEETDSDTNDTATVFYYSDAFFEDAPERYSSYLATASLNMAYAGMYLRAKETPDERDSTGNYYYNRHAAARQFMADIGCLDRTIYVNESNEKKPGTDSIGVTIAHKELAYKGGEKTGAILIPVVVRGGGYELEWASNATLDQASNMQEEGKEAEARGFSSAADQVMSEIEKYIAKYSLGDALAEGRVKFWITGYSRAGATANITAKRLVETYADGSEGKKNQVYGYTCEAPMGGSDLAEKLDDKTKYYCIHNLINAVDIVPHVAPQLMGFKRYGVDHYIPGTATGEVKVTSAISGKTNRSGAGGPYTVTTYRDNDIKYIKNSDSTLKNLMLMQLRAVDSGIIFDDYFHPMSIKFVPGVSIYENGHYDHNHAEAFVADFLRFAQEGMKPEEYMAKTQAISNRVEFAQELQGALRDTLALVMTMDAESSSGFMGRVSTIMSKFIGLGGNLTKAEFYFEIIRGWDGLSASDKDSYYKRTWSLIESTGAFDFLSASETAKLEKNWPNLANVLFTLVNADYKYNPEEYHYSDAWAGGTDGTNTLLGTFVTYATYILQNHYPEVNLAWARTYDDLYENEFTEYEILYGARSEQAGYTVAKPAASCIRALSGPEKDGESEIISLKEGAEETNRITGGQTVLLDTEGIVGEAVYYDLLDRTTGKLIAANLLYRGGVNLTAGGQPSKQYTITAYAISYGVRSEKAVYNIDLLNSVHRIIVDNGSDAEPLEYHYEEGREFSLSANPSGGRYFTGWKIRLVNAGGETVSENIAEALLGEDAEKESAVFTLPLTDAEIPGESTVVIPEGYSLEITAVCPSRIREIHAAFAAPAAGSVLADEAMLTFDNGRSGKYPISWTYEEETQEESLSYESAAEEADISPVPETEKPELSEANPAESSGEEKEAEDSVSEKPEADEPEGSEAFAALEDNDEPLPEEGEADTLHEDTDTLREEADTLHKTVSSKPSEENEPDGEEKKDSEKDASEPEEDERQSESLIEESESASSKTVPSSGIAWGDTAYTAVIFVPQDMANQILFADQLSGSSESGEVTKVIRNNADGSAEIEIEFEKTAESGEYVRPDAEISLLAKAFDLNLQDYDESFTRQYYVPGNRIVTLSAPEVEDELFLQWNLLDSGIILADEDNDGQPDCSLSDRVIKVRIPEMPAGNELEIRAEFIPGIREVSAEISIPVTGQPLQSEANADTLKVTISNQYEIDPEFVSISWTPQPESEESEEKIADYLMYYTVVIRIVPKTDSEGQPYVNVRKTGEEAYIRTKADVFLQENLKATVNGEEASINREDRSLSYTFEITKLTLLSVSQPECTASVPDDMEEEEVTLLLADTLTLTIDDGNQVDMPVKWSLEKEADSASWTATTDAELPKLIEDKYKLFQSPITLNISIDTETALSPVASAESGTYFSDLSAELITREEGGTTWYAIGDSDQYQEYDGSLIEISRSDAEHLTDEVIMTDGDVPVLTGRKVFVLKAYTTKPGKADSAAVTYSYVFDNEITLPEGLDSRYTGSEQIGIDASAFYTIEEVDGGGRVTEDGDAAARNTGTYRARLKVMDGFVWKTEDGTTGEDQYVSFAIEPEDLSEVAELRAEGTFHTLDDLKKALEVLPTDERTLSEGTDYELTFSDVIEGKATVTASGTGNYTGMITGTFLVDESEKEIFMITLNLNGGTLNGASGTITEQYYEGDVIVMPKPSRSGYTFRYWKGSEYRAGEKYTVTEDHTFVAQWCVQERYEPAPKDENSGSGTVSVPQTQTRAQVVNTSDNTHILMWSFLFVISLLLGGSSALILRSGKSRL